MLACATLTYRLRAVFVAAAVILLVGLGCASVDAAPFAVPNPYASGLGDNDIAIRRAVVFGDSYSKYKRKPWHNWAEQLRYDQINPALSKTSDHCSTCLCRKRSHGRDLRRLDQRFHPPGDALAWDLAEVHRPRPHHGLSGLQRHQSVARRLGRRARRCQGGLYHPAAADHRRWRGRQVAPHLLIMPHNWQKSAL